MPGLSPIKMKLAVGQVLPVPAVGTTIFIRKSIGELKVTAFSQRVGAGDGERYTLNMVQADEWLLASQYDRLEIENLSGLENAVILYLGFGSFSQPVPSIVNVQVTSSLEERVQTFGDETTIGIGAAGAISLIAQDDRTIYAVVTALTTNTDIIRIGDSAVDIDQGIPLAAGETIKWTSKAQCFACSEAVANQGAAVTKFLE